MALRRIVPILGMTLLLGACGISVKEQSLSVISGEVTAISCEEERGYRYSQDYTVITLDEKYGFQAPSTYCTKVKVGVEVTIEYDAEMYARNIRYGKSNSEVTEE